MIQPLFNGMIRLLLAKFMLNDVPHMLGIGSPSNFPWVNEAWYKLNAYAISHGIKFFSPDEAYISMVEHRMPTNDIRSKPLSESATALLTLYKQSLVKPMPNWKLPSRSSIEKLRSYMAGYHLIAIGEASDHVVNDVYYLIKDSFLKFAEDYREGRKRLIGEEEFTGSEVWYHDLQVAANLFVDGSRADKVIAIDAAAHLLHEYEPRPLIEDLFVSEYLESFETTPMWIALGQLFDIWFGIDPRRGMSLVEYIGEE